MGIFDRILGRSSETDSQETYTRDDLRRDAIEDHRINSMPVQKPSNRLWEAHPDMPEINEKYERVISSHLFHPDSEICLYPIHVPDALKSNDIEEHFTLVLGIEAQMEVPFIIYSAEEYFVPGDSFLLNRYEGSLLATPWGEALVIPCDLLIPSHSNEFDEEHMIPLPREMHQKVIPKSQLEDEEMESYYNLAMAGMVRK